MVKSACAKSAMRAFWRRNVDLPAMFGPVKSQIVSALPFSSLAESKEASKLASDATKDAAKVRNFPNHHVPPLRLPDVHGRH